MTDRIGDDLRFFQTAINLRQQRQEVLASNIANADTPNYKARDFDFRSALQNAMGESMRLADTHLALTSARHIPAKALTPDPAELLYRKPLQPSLDGNTVEMSTEQTLFAENAVKYRTTLSFLEGRINTITRALKGE